MRKAAFITLFMFIIFVVGCTPISQSTLEGSITETVGAPTSLLPIATPTVIPSHTILPTSTVLQPTATLTPLPTLPTSTAEALVSELLQTNAGCQLPCWWGITPGVTTWQEVRNFLSTFIVERMHGEPHIVGHTPDMSSFTGFFVFQGLEDGTSEQGYRIQNGIVDQIEINFGDLALYDLVYLLSEYGLPDEVLVKTLDIRADSAPFDTIVFYRDLGILAKYSSDANRHLNTIQQCYLIRGGKILVLWNASQTMTFEEVANLTSGISLDPFTPYLPIGDVTNMDVSTFFETFKESPPNNCLETPADIWPGYE